MSDRVRIYFTGDCDGFDALRGALASTDEIDVVGRASRSGAAATPLAGGHLDCVLHATRDRPSRPARSPRSASTRARRSSSSPPAPRRRRCSSPRIEMDVATCCSCRSSRTTSSSRSARRRTRGASCRPPPHRGRVVTVFSPKGGTGKTVVATNLAAMLAKKEGRRTLLLDLDLQFGDAAIMLGLEPEKTIYDLVVAPGELDSGEARRLRHRARVRARRPGRAAAARGRRARRREQGDRTARGRAGVLRRDRRRHVAVLPRRRCSRRSTAPTSCSSSAGSTCRR